jgi:hypothetical protein
MKVDSMSISNGELVLSAGGRTLRLRDGVYEGPDGQAMTLSNHKIVAFDQRYAALAAAEAAVKEAETYAQDLNQKLATSDRAELANVAEEIRSHVKDLAEPLSTIGDDAQLANIDLQNMLQKQQQTIQMLSNISKILHDTALAVIRKIG